MSARVGVCTDSGDPAGTSPASSAIGGGEATAEVEVDIENPEVTVDLGGDINASCIDNTEVTADVLTGAELSGAVPNARGTAGSRLGGEGRWRERRRARASEAERIATDERAHHPPRELERSGGGRLSVDHRREARA